ncbi:hypothetical protein HQ571_02755 [Candidatus Kuenenbacteria bacterium]|nr:hypothetical protein [Candidatus Kuenenbacteria bacterium]
MKSWLIVLAVRSEMNTHEYLNLVTDKIVTAFGKYYKTALYCSEIKTSFLPYVGQIHSLYFNVAAPTPQEAINFVGGWSTEYYCQPPNMVNNINCLGEFSSGLLLQTLQA